MQKYHKVSPSILASKNPEMDLGKLAGADFLHVDVMDGKFVEQTTSYNNSEKIKELRKYTSLPFDIHLMVENPEKRIGEFIDYAHYLTVHIEAAKDLKSIINYAKERKIKFGVALNPNTEAEKIYEFLPDIDMIVLMSVYPGKCGQEFIDIKQTLENSSVSLSVYSSDPLRTSMQMSGTINIIEKIKVLREIIQKKNYKAEIEVDGGIKRENAYKVINAGANIIVSGSGIFNFENNSEIISEMKNPILIGSDHAGFELKEILKSYMHSKALAYWDMGTYSKDSCDYPMFAKKLAEQISSGNYKKGILICGTGIGMSITANRFPNTRAALCTDAFTAESSRRHNNSNILVLGERVLKQTGADAKEIFDKWLETEFDGLKQGGERHLKRVGMIDSEK